MPTTAKIHTEQQDELDSALQSISKRWQGNLAAYLDALARAKEAAESGQNQESVVRSTVSFSRLSKRR